MNESLVWELKSIFLQASTVEMAKRKTVAIDWVGMVNM